jgi:CelD/BcsL family acetyltransferase involved in cellulose biosynthesis
MAQFGDVRFLTATDSTDASRTLEILMEPKGRALARKGVADIFAPPGHREFFLDLASDPKTSRNGAACQRAPCRACNGGASG